MSQFSSEITIETTSCYEYPELICNWLTVNGNFAMSGKIKRMLFFQDEVCTVVAPYRVFPEKIDKNLN